MMQHYPIQDEIYSNTENISNIDEKEEGEERQSKRKKQNKHEQLLYISVYTVYMANCQNPVFFNYIIIQILCSAFVSIFF